MVQEFHVVRCFSCQTFQVQQVKKVNRWSCKLCGEKQSLLQEFGRGSGADCRRHVQKLNAMRGTMMEEQEHHTWTQVEADSEDEPKEQVTHTEVSSWSKYLDTPEGMELKEDEEENVLMDRQQLHGNNMTDRKRKRRDLWTDIQQQDRRTPQQLNCLSLMSPIRPSDTTSPPSLNRTSQPSLNQTSHPSLKLTSPPSLNWISPPSLNRISPPSLRHTIPPSLNRTSHPSLKLTSPPSLNRISPPSLRHTIPPSLNRTSHPSLKLTSPPSLNRISPPSQRHTIPPSLNRTSPPSLNQNSFIKTTNTPSMSTGLVSRWAPFLNHDRQMNEVGEGPPINGCSQSVDGAASLSRPLLHVSSIFQSGDEFIFDDDFLAGERK
ncbi:MRN complex-interacting protein isoform X2 [Acanthopagrus latus]|uniref:MRN complex-interacting protein isoform X2 n=1 Tax=Acanthopagrus latus TaxID=8177 RepID=UPI00187BFDEF|nr:MRN complex-interacting protein isoform X2 [Acanthopagrus latus]